MLLIVDVLEVNVLVVDVLELDVLGVRQISQWGLAKMSHDKFYW
jgi:hypothetical protein